MKHSTRRYEELCQEMSAHTRPECDKCLAPYGCCNAIACLEAAAFAKEILGIELKVPDKPVPFLTPTGCSLAPHLRPMCTVYTCSIHSIGHKPGDDRWNEKYWQLRDAINEELHKIDPLL